MKNFSDTIRNLAPAISSGWSAVQLVANLALTPVSPPEIVDFFPQESICQVEESVDQAIDPAAMYNLASNAGDALNFMKEEEGQQSNEEEESPLPSGGEVPNKKEDEQNILPSPEETQSNQPAEDQAQSVLPAPCAEENAPAETQTIER